jgi:hypothetical protein
MAIKGGQILHTANGFLVDRIQTAGVSSLNINEERIEELGNYQAIGTIRDIPDLTFELESYDMSTAIENILTGRAETFSTPGTELDLVGNYTAIDVLSPFKQGPAGTSIVKSLAIPYLSLESLSYAFSLTDPASMTATLRGDSVFYSPGDVYRETWDGDAVTTDFTLGGGSGGTGGAGPSLKTVIAGVDYWVLGVTVDGVRQFQGAASDYTATSTVVSFNTAPASGTDNVVIVYALAATQTYAQAVHDSTVPVAVRGRDIEVIVADSGGGNPVSWTGVQSGSVDWRVSLERDEEFNNPNVVGQDFDIPEVSGSISLKPSDSTALWDKIMQAAGVSVTDQVANATNDVPELQVEVIFKDPADGSSLKTLIIPDAKFTLPSLQGSVGSKLETDFAYTSAGGVLEIYVGDN